MGNRGTLILFALLVIILILCTGKTTYSQNETREDADTCITSKCHTAIGKDTFVHMPVTDGDCITCHGDVPEHGNNPDKYPYGDIKEPDDTCFECHDTFESRKFIHEPVQDGECTACHSSHGSPYKFHLLEGGRDLCFMCHDDGIISEKFIHGPAEAGVCIACHDPHSADYEKNLRERPPDLCFGCHANKEAEFRTAKVVHKPAVESCTNCHNPHSAPKQYMLENESPELCFTCHTAQKDWVNNAAVQHGALMTGKTCLNCHEPHVSNIANRLSMAPMDLCLSCHDKEVNTTGGRDLTNMKKLLTEHKVHHGPIKQKDCSGCHNPHGSDEFRILKEEYASEFYMPFNS